MTSIDLIPAAVHTRREAHRRLAAWAARLGLGGVVALMFYLGLSQLATAKHSDLQQMTIEYSALQEQIGQAKYLLGERERLSDHHRTIDLIRQSRSAGWHLQRLSEVFLDESYLTSLDINLCPHLESSLVSVTGDDCEAGFTLKGRARGTQRVGQIIHNMEASSEYDAVSLISIDKIKNARWRDEVEFQLNCVLSTGNGDE